MHRLHICCTMRANVSFAICGNAESFGCGKAIRGNLRNVPHLIFGKLPLHNFPYSAIHVPQNIRAHNLPSRVQSTVWTFADDCLLYREIGTFDTKILQGDQDSLQVWEQDWLMEFNPSKCEAITFIKKTKPRKLSTGFMMSS